MATRTRPKLEAVTGNPGVTPACNANGATARTTAASLRRSNHAAPRRMWAAANHTT